MSSRTPRPKRGGPKRAPNRGRGARPRAVGGGGRRSRSGPRRGVGGDQVEGRHAVRELLLAGTRPVREVYIAAEQERSDILDDIRDLANELGVTVRPVSRKRLGAEAMTGSHQGVVARAAPLAETGLHELTGHEQPFLLVLDGVTDPQNLGAVLRTAECAGVNGVVLPRHRSVHVTPTVAKAAAGAIEHLPFSIVGGIPTALSEMADAGLTTIGLDAAGTRSIFDPDAFVVSGSDAAGGGIALVLGAEGLGLSRLVRQRVDTLVAIPLQGGLNSLNVAAAAAIACFEIVRRRQNSF